MRHLQKKLVGAAVAVASGLGFTGVTNAASIYNVQNYLAIQNGYSLSGSIQVSDTATADGLLLESELEAWDFTIRSVSDGSIATSLSSTEPNNIFALNVLIDSNSIRLAGGFSQLVFGYPNGFSIVNWYRFTDLGVGESYHAWTESPQQLWEYRDPGPNDLGGDPWVIAKTIPPAIPLPAAFPLFGTGLGILGFLGWRRRRKMAAA